MNIGMNLLLWTAKVTEAHDPLLADLKKTGYDGVEIPVFEGTSAEYKALGGKLKNLGLGATAVTVMAPDASPISADPKVRQAAVDRLKWVLDRCAEFNCEVLCGPLHSPLGVFSGTGPTADERKRGVETFKQVAEHAKAAKVTLAVEYLNRFENYFLTTAADTYQWVGDINHPSCGMMWDTFHAHIEEKNSPAALEAIAKRLVHVHLSENDRGTPGTGQIAWAETFAILKKIKYDRWLTIEAFGRALPDLAAATRVWRDLFADPKDVYTQGLDFIKRGMK
ncbi:MAG: sugar phosphate isomerase/epimerase [Verrucomicrobia bacterium]|nr:sugar phosphate isomerase/epimerase [Verrucomicrobiota bacterium]